MHIYTANMQPATGYVDQCGEIEFSGGYTPYQLIYCRCCGKKRRAKNCVVQCYYDGLRIWCAEGKGCKNLAAVAARKRKHHMNRSRAQQARWARAGADATQDKRKQK